MAKANPTQFVRQVREETAKVTWPTRKETLITTVMVFIFAAFMGVFFLLVDTVFTFILGTVFGLGS
jgi:preprotein translocase subunit SecE